MNKEKKKRLYYYLFDWANSPYSTIIITFIFSSYFVNVIAENKVQGTSLWGWTIALSGFFISPCDQEIIFSGLAIEILILSKLVKFGFSTSFVKLSINNSFKFFYLKVPR